jgi:hypothetical protein
MEEAPKNAVLEMMARRDRERKIAIEKNQKTRQEKSELEGVDYFDSTFDKKIYELENRMNSVKPSNDVALIQEEFTAILKELQELQKFFTSSTIFLNDYKIKNCQITLNQLFAKCEEKKLDLLPKKKFGFKNKTAKTETKAEEKVDGANIEPETVRKEFIWTESQKSNVVLRYEGDDVNEKDLTFKGMQNCVIIIKGHAGSLQMLNLKNCLVLCGSISRSAFLENCENCTFAFACQQLRLHSSTSCDIYIHVTSRAIIEDCKEIHFAPSTYSYEDYNEHMTLSGLDSNVNNWRDVGDFNWLSADKPSPNWSEIEEERRISAWDEFIIEFMKNYNVSLD